MDSTLLLLAQTDQEVTDLLLVVGGVALGMAIFVSIQALICWIAWKTATAIPPGFREMDPALAWFLMIPCVSLILNFLVFPKISAGYRRYFDATRTDGNGDCGAGLGFWYSLCCVFSAVPYLGVIPGCAALFLLIFLLIRLWDLKREAEQIQLGLVGSSVMAAPAAPMRATPSMRPTKNRDPRDTWE